MGAPLAEASEAAAAEGRPCLPSCQDLSGAPLRSSKSAGGPWGYLPPSKRRALAPVVPLVNCAGWRPLPQPHQRQTLGPPLTVSNPVAQRPETPSTVIILRPSFRLPRRPFRPWRNHRSMQPWVMIARPDSGSRRLPSSFKRQQRGWRLPSQPSVQLRRQWKTTWLSQRLNSLRVLVTFQ